jgi:hypothetical protein
MSAYGIAAELNRRKVSALNGVPVLPAANLMKILEPNWREHPFLSLRGSLVVPEPLG